MGNGGTMTTKHEYMAINSVPSRICFILAAIIVLLAFTHSTIMVCWSSKACGIAMEPINRFGHLFDLSREMNIPTWYSVLQLFAVASALAVAAKVQQVKT